MLDCAGARELLLTVDLDPVQMSEKPELTHHVQQCAECRSLYKHLVDGHARFMAGVNRLQPRTELVESRSLSVRTRRIGLAAAAIGVFFLTARLWTARSPDALEIPIRPTVAASSVVVQAPDNFIVMQTDNPKITVVWLYERDPR